MLRWCAIIVVSSALLVACGGTFEADIQATVQAGVAATRTQEAAIASAVRATQDAQSTPTPAVTVASYKAAVTQQIGALNDALAAFTELLTKASRPSDPAWRTKVDTQLTAIRTVHAHLEQLEVPRAMESIHKALLDASGDCDKAAKLIGAGLDGNSTAMQLAMDLLGSCGGKISDVVIKVQASENP